jgi:HEAT repeat protein
LWHSMKVEILVKIFRMHGDHKQRALIRKLSADPSSAFALLKEIIHGNYSPSIQRWAFEGLSVCSKRRALPLLRNGIKSPHMSVRLHALLGIAEFNDSKLASDLRPLLRDESGGVRLNALCIIEKMKPRWLRLEATKALQDEKSYIRQKAKRILKLSS